MTAAYNRMLSPSKQRDRDFDSSSGPTYRERDPVAFRKLDKMQAFDTAPSPNGGTSTRTYPRLQQHMSKPNCCVSVAVYDATDYFMGPKKDPRVFNLANFEHFPHWPMTEVPIGSFCAAIHSITRYRTDEGWMMSLGYYALIVLGDMDVVGA